MTAPGILILFRGVSPVYKANLLTMVETVQRLGLELILLCHEGSDLSGIPVTQPIFLDLDDVSAVRSRVKGIAKTAELKRIYALDEFDVYSAALCREENNIDGLLPDNCICFRDKNVMHARAKELGFLTPECCLPHTLMTIEGFIERVGYPIIIKPHNGSGSENTFKVSSKDELDPVWRSIRNERHNYRVEEFIQGKQFFIDAISQNGEVVFDVLFQYTYHVINFRDEVPGIISMRKVHNESHRQMLELNRNLLRGFGLRNGATHTEFFLTEDGRIYLGEVAARGGGGPIATVLKFGFGFLPAEEWILSDLDPKRRILVQDGPEIGAEYLTANYFNAWGRITLLSSAEELKKIDSVVDAQVWRKVGDVIVEPKACYDVLGYYICTGLSPDDVLGKFRTIREQFRVQTERE